MIYKTHKHYNLIKTEIIYKSKRPSKEALVGSTESQIKREAQELYNRERAENVCLEAIIKNQS